MTTPTTAYTDTHLHASHVLRAERPRRDPLARDLLRDAERKVLEHAAEELVVRELHGVDPYVLAQLDDHELVLRRARAEHVPVLLRRQYRRRALGRLVRPVDPRGAVERRVVEPVRERDAEVRREQLGRPPALLHVDR